MIKKILIPTAIVAALLLGIYALGYYKSTKLPDNNPEAFLKQKGDPNAKVVVCVGDSNTHGRVTCDYVAMLSERMEKDGYTFINAGINSELAYNVVQRLDTIIKCKPDYITILIGSNDANGSVREVIARRQMKEMALPVYPTKDWFRENLVKIIDTLRDKTDARLALLSLPPIGEDKNHEAFKRAAEYSDVIKSVARSRNVTYLPLNETMTSWLEGKKASPTMEYDSHELMMYRSIFMHIIMGKSYNEISKGNGFNLLIDYLHLNCNAAGMVADLIETFIQKEKKGY